LPYNLYKRSESYTALIAKGLIYKYCFDYLDKNREVFKQYANGGDFLDNFVISQDFYKKMITFAQSQDVNTNGITNGEQNEIKLLMKSYLAQNLYGDEYFYKLYLQIDKDIQKVLNLISKL
jgi:hypothetical protein